jgi:ATP-dependent Clp protease adaptor protein ClpS
MVLEKTHKITLYNDSKHDFLYVIACLIKFCKHTPDQAEQCAVIVDKKGLYDIKSGSFDNMYEILMDLENMELKVKLNACNLHQ